MDGKRNDDNTMHVIPQPCPLPLRLSSKLQIPSNNGTAGDGRAPTSKGAKARDPPSTKVKNGSQSLPKPRALTLVRNRPRGGSRLVRNRLRSGSRLASIGEEPRVRFDPDLIKPKSRPTGKAAPIALRVCNKLLDRFPKGFKQCQWKLLSTLELQVISLMINIEGWIIKK